MPVLNFRKSREGDGFVREDENSSLAPSGRRLRSYGFTPLQQVIEQGKASPLTLRMMVAERQGREVRLTKTVLPLAKTEVSPDGELSGALPNVCEPPYYTEILGTAHELAHQDGFEAAAQAGYSVDRLRNLPKEAGVVAEVYALEQEEAFIRQVPRPLRGDYSQRRKQLRGAARRLRQKLPEDVQKALPKRLKASSWFEVFSQESTPQRRPGRRGGFLGRRRR